MATHKITQKPAGIKKPTITLRLLVRVDERGGYDVIGFNVPNDPSDIDDLRSAMNDYTVCEGKCEEYVMDVEVPSYSGYTADTRFTLKVSY